MNNNLSIEMQVAALTEEQKDKIIKIDNISGIVVIVSAIPAILLMLLNIAAMFNINLPFEVVDGLLVTNFILIGLCILFIVGVFVFIKIKFPYFSSKKSTFIRKERKNKK